MGASSLALYHKMGRKGTKAIELGPIEGGRGTERPCMRLRIASFLEAR
jgi:hypothetical protein